MNRLVPLFVFVLGIAACNVPPGPGDVDSVAPSDEVTTEQAAVVGLGYTCTQSTCTCKGEPDCLKMYFEKCCPNPSPKDIFCGDAICAAGPDPDVCTCTPKVVNSEGRQRARAGRHLRRSLRELRPEPELPVRQRLPLVRRLLSRLRRALPGPAEGQQDLLVQVGLRAHRQLLHGLLLRTAASPTGHAARPIAAGALRHHWALVTGAFRW
jgi:hypothetical protein